MPGWAARNAVVAVVMAIGGLLPALAQAQPRPPDAVAHYWDARLIESSTGDFEAAIAQYRELLADPRVREAEVQYARVLEAKGRAHWSLGQLDAALDAFKKCSRIESSGRVTDANADPNCGPLARLVVLEQSAVTALPTTWDFEPETQHGFVLLSERGTMRLERTSMGTSLVWNQELAAQDSADLAAGMRFARGVTPKGLRLKIRAPLDKTRLDIIVLDRFGRSYESEIAFGADNRIRQWNVTFDSFTRRLPDQPPLNPADIAQVRFRASPLLLPETRTGHRIVLDDVTFY